MQVNVDVAKRDWPGAYPGFFDAVLGGLEADDAGAPLPQFGGGRGLRSCGDLAWGLSRTPLLRHAGKSIALTLLRIVAEEFVSTRADVPARRSRSKL